MHCELFGGLVEANCMSRTRSRSSDVKSTLKTFFRKAAETGAVDTMLPGL